jgi:hypothetical protein
MSTSIVETAGRKRLGCLLLVNSDLIWPSTGVYDCI